MLMRGASPVEAPWTFTATGVLGVKGGGRWAGRLDGCQAYILAVMHFRGVLIFENGTT